jgi:PAS domain S-box-containing protein
MNNSHGLFTNDSKLDQLRERMSELESENARLRHLDETVRRNARLFEALLRKSQDGFSLVTPEMTFLRVIHSALGHDEESLLGRSVLTKIHPDDHAQVRDAFARLLGQPSKALVLECRASDSTGAWRWLEVEMSDQLDDPDVQAIVWNCRDITTLKKCQETARELSSRPCSGECMAAGTSRSNADEF